MVFQEYICVFQEAASLPSTNDNIGKGFFSLNTLESSVQIGDESRWYLSILYDTFPDLQPQQVLKFQAWKSELNNISEIRGIIHTQIGNYVLK